MKNSLHSIIFILISFTASNGQRVSSPPMFTSHEVTAVAAGSEYYYAITAMDSLKRPVSFTAATLPLWMKYDAASNTLSGKPMEVGQYLVQIKASNGVATASQNFMVTATNKQTCSILALGNSITNGTDKYDSYRRALWKKLHDGGYNIDFIGSWGKHHMGGDVPDPDFDMDHDGHSGWNFADMLNPPSWDAARGNFGEWIKTYTPDIVLLELGTNDVFQCRSVDDMMHDLNTIVGLLRNKNAAVKIFVAQIPPLGPRWAGEEYCGDYTLNDLLIKLNKRLADVVKQSKGQIMLVDQYSGVDATKHMYDDIHPNEIGEGVMASRWFDAIKPYLKKYK